ncbi:MAG: hypothetical protein QOH06_5081 [Acidobacteriota bacterium]|jgi:hypothetical protein|nr:hypothetical protein [Acidobacteriota bacterium]
MSIPVPTLDDRSYADLLEEARTLIPSLAPGWTNHNPSDPGITLVELFAWLTEMMIYRVNRLPEENTVAFLRLLNGPQWTPGEDLEADIRATVSDLRRRHRAVTAEDYEVLARESSAGVARARCVAKRNLAMSNEVDRRVLREGYVSVVVVPNTSITAAVNSASLPGAPLPSSSLLAEVEGNLQPRRLVTVRQFVVPPVYVPIQAGIVVATRPDVAVGPLRGRVKEAIEGYLDALTGGPDGEGWPFGRDVYASEIYRLLEKVPGVDYVPDVTLSSTVPSGAPRAVAGSELWHEGGDQIGIELQAHHLPWAQIDPTKIVIGSSFLPVRIHVVATATATFDPAAVRRAAKNKVKLLFNWPAGATEGQEITGIQIAAAVDALTEVATVANVTIEADPARLFGDGIATGVRFEAGEHADLTVTVEA